MNYKTFKQKIKLLFSLPPKKFVRKISKKMNAIILDKITEKMDIKSDNYIKSELKILYSYINSSQFDISMIDTEQSIVLCDMILNHCFDLLGSGFVKVNYNINSLGVEGIRYDMSPKIKTFDSEGEWLNNILLPSHVNYAKVIWKKVDRDYIPIDWQIDFKSGFRYSQKIWYKKQPIGKPLGTDIKVPWEISRMQHLPLLGIFSLVLPDKKYKLIKEFKNQLYDFATTNPLRMGANWTCTMDVGIRASNILVAHNILKGIDENNILDDDFERFFENSIYEHGEFIIKNLEWHDGNNNNHYLSDICGLLFISAYLERNEVVDSWLAFSVQEIINCMEKQFHSDGGNFENSTSYHRLSGELIIYSTALIYGLLKTDKVKALKEYNPKLVKRLLKYDKQRYNIDNEKFFPDWYLGKLFKAGCLTMDIMKINEKISQIGDNDSGRFFIFSLLGEFLSLENLIKKYDNLKEYKGIERINKYFDENILNHSTFISAVNGLFDYKGFKSFSTKYPLERSIVESLAKGFKLKGKYSNDMIKVLKVDVPNLKFRKETKIRYEGYINRRISIEKLKHIAYPDFGLYIFKGSQFYLSIFAGNTEQNRNNNHSHNDKLSFELNLGGKDIFVDSGTYVYTPLPEKRNMFRSIKAHNVPVVNDEEQNEFINLFSIDDETKCCVLDYNNNRIKLYLTYRDIKIIREFIIYNDKLVINDFCNKTFYVNLVNGAIYSNGYGKQIRRM